MVFIFDSTGLEKSFRILLVGLWRVCRGGDIEVYGLFRVKVICRMIYRVRFYFNIF